MQDKTRTQRGYKRRMRYLNLRLIHFLLYLLSNVGQAENKVRTECGILEKKYRNLQAIF